MDLLENIIAPKFSNEVLQTATNRIIKIGNNVRKSMFEIAHIISEVDASESYKEDGFSNVAEWCEKTFGFKKTSTYDLIRIGKDYTEATVDKNGKVIGYKSNLTLADAKTDFTTTQIGACLSVSRETLTDLVNDEKITPEMSVRAIKKVIKEQNNVVGEVIDPEETDTDNTDNTDINEEIDPSFTALYTIASLMKEHNISINDIIAFMNGNNDDPLN